jgi:hypothetical protein
LKIVLAKAGLKMALSYFLCCHPNTDKLVLINRVIDKTNLYHFAPRNAGSKNSLCTHAISVQTSFFYRKYIMLKKSSIFIPALLVATLTGCSSFYRFQEVKDTNLVDVSYDAVSTLQDKLAHPIPKNSLIIVSTLVNVDNQNQTSSFGRIISDQVASAFHDSGYQIIGMELPIDLFVMQEGGQLHLTPEIRQMLKRYNANNIVGGVYAPGKKNTYVSLRLIDLNSRSFVSSADFSVPMGPDAKTLLQPKTVTTEVPPAQSSAPTESSTGLSIPEPIPTEPAAEPGKTGSVTE